ncbi:unnamed protein product [Staurois parvus]|uniref:Secreted protein n=1 Tax=Staurois parvus TaxID=386267 RepID=A0ABN9HDE1_9NEOB|nr:unnamed protein product [Staurois parvus]
MSHFSQLFPLMVAFVFLNGCPAVSVMLQCFCPKQIRIRFAFHLNDMQVFDLAFTDVLFSAWTRTLALPRHTYNTTTLPITLGSCHDCIPLRCAFSHFPTYNASTTIRTNDIYLVSLPS